jgi:hypothetical protein
MEISQWGSIGNGLVHLYLCQFIAQSKTVREPDRLSGMGGNVALKARTSFFLWHVAGVAEVDAVGQTHIVCASRDQTPVHPMMAEVAFYGKISGLVKGDGMVWAFIEAEPATGAFFRIQNHDTVFPLGNGVHRTGRHTGRVIAVPAHGHVKHKIHSAFRELGAVLQDPDQLDPVGDIKFLFASDLTGPASPASLVIDNKGMGFHCQSP